MAYKFQQDAAQLSGSVTINAGNNLLFQLDARTDIGTASKQVNDIFTQVVTASVSLSGTAVRANYFYGNGENITGISSDTVDIKATVGTGSQPILNVPSVASDQSITGSTLFAWDNGESHLLLGATSGKTPSLTIGSGHAQDGLIVFDGNNVDWCLGYDATSENFEIGTDNALGSQPTFTIGADGTGAFTFTGSAPSLTIGGGDEVDTKIVFDGAAADFYLGIDDDDDKLHIGLGSTVGTTANLVLDSANRNVTVGGDLTVSGNDIDCAAGDANLFATAGANTISVGGTTSVTYQKGGTQYQVSESAGPTLTLDESHSYIIFNSTAAITGTLPSGVGTGTVYRIKRSNECARPVTLTSSGEIDGESTITLQTAGAAVNVIYDGSDWHIY